MHDKTLLGWREWLSLPTLAIPAIKAKVDTGARTSALHVAELNTYTENHCHKVKFKLHPLPKRTDIELICTADVLDERLVRDSGGHTEQRIVIYTPIRLGALEWPIEVTLTNREDMLFRMLLGRTALNGRFIVDPQLSYQAGKRPPRRLYQKGQKNMKIAILSRNPQLYSTRRLAEAGQTRGHEIRIINHLRCYMNITSHYPSIHYRGEKLAGFDAVIPRIGASVTFYGTAVLRQFEMMSVFPLNESVAISRSRDKLRSLQLLSRKGIGLPITGFAHSPDDTQDLIKLVGGAPLVVKLLEGTQGVGVVLAETDKAAESVIEAFRGLKANILVQEFIKEAGGADIRCLVIGDRVVATMLRQGKEGDFRSNLHRGGSARLIRITPEERSTAVRSAKIMGLNVAGVDILRSNHGPVVMEVNSSPGLEGIEKATGKDIAGMIIQFIEKNARPGHTRTRGTG